MKNKTRRQKLIESLNNPEIEFMRHFELKLQKIDGSEDFLLVIPDEAVKLFHLKEHDKFILTDLLGGDFILTKTH